MSVSRSCQYCATRFSTDQERRIFCSDRCKMRYHREHRLTCWYCGELGTSIEHLFPQAFGDGKGDTVMACKECNSTVQAFKPMSVSARVKYLFQAYVKRYRLNKFIPEWDDQEIEELRGTLKQRVRAKILARQRAVERVEHLRSLFCTLEDATLPSPIQQARLDAESEDESFFLVSNPKPLPYRWKKKT